MCVCVCKMPRRSCVDVLSMGARITRARPTPINPYYIVILYAPPKRIKSRHCRNRRRYGGLSGVRNNILFIIYTHICV